CRRDEIVLATLELNVTHRDRRNAGAQSLPRTASVKSDEDTVLRTRKQDVLVHAIFGKGPDFVAIGKIPENRRPRSATVGALEHVRCEVAAKHVVERRVDNTGIEP